MSSPYWICVVRTATGRFATSRSRRCNLLRPHAHPPAVHISGALIWRCVKGASETAPKESRAMPTPKKVRLADSFGRGREKDKKARPRVATSPGSEVGYASLRSSQGDLPKRQSPTRRRLITASVGYSPSRDPSTAWTVVFFGCHRTASSIYRSAPST